MLTINSRKHKRVIVIPDGYSYCVGCDDVLPVEAFSKCKTYPTNCFPYCKACHKEVNKRHSKKIRERRVLNCYGVSVQEYEDRMLRQRGVCAICGQPEKVRDRRTGKVRALAVDHCHDSGQVRGLLCQRCNLGIGYLAHYPTILEKAIEYLQTQE